MKYAKKSLGQNFLVDKNIVNKIINISDLAGKNVVEIGPGKGALTNQIILKKPKTIILIEKDNDLYKSLKDRYRSFKNIIIYNYDILQFDFEKKIKKNSIIFGNLPYNISSQILVKIIRSKKSSSLKSELIFMFQKEMAERITGKFGTAKYGRLSILANYRYKIKNEFNVSPNCFFPKPKVNSTVLSFKPNLVVPRIKNIENLEKITNIFFSNKRKMINKTVKKNFKNNINIFKKLDLSLRPSEIKPELYYKITELFENGS